MSNSYDRYIEEEMDYDYSYDDYSSERDTNDYPDDPEQEDAANHHGQPPEPVSDYYRGIQPTHCNSTVGCDAWVVTRDGRKVVRLAHFPEATKYQVVEVLEHADDEPSTLTAEGKFNAYACGVESDWDLFMLPQKRTVFLNVWLNEDHGLPFVQTGPEYYSKEAAQGERTTSCTGNKKKLLKTIEVEYEV